MTAGSRGAEALEGGRGEGSRLLTASGSSGGQKTNGVSGQSNLASASGETYHAKAQYGTVASFLQDDALEVKAENGTLVGCDALRSLAGTPEGSESGARVSAGQMDGDAALLGGGKKKRRFFAPWFTPSFVVVALVVLNGDSARGALFPTLWPLVSSLGGDRIIQGYVVSAFSFGRLIASPFVGRMSEVYGYRAVLVITSLIILLGTLLYASATTIWHVLASQIVMGIGSGTLGVTRAYVAEQTARQRRTVLLAYLTAVQYAGFTVMPLVGGILEDAFGPVRIQLLGPLRADHYTAPALFMGVMSLLSVILLVTVFEDHSAEHRLKAAEKKAKKAAAAEAAASVNGTAGEGASLTRQPSSGLTGRQNMVIIGGVLLNVATKGSIAIYETLGIQFATSHFPQLTSADAGFIFACFGFMGVIALLYMKRLCYWFNDVQLIVGGMAFMIACNLLLVGPPHFPIWRFYVAIFFMYSIGYPVGHTAVIGMFSKVLGKRPQGALMGWFGSAGSLARVIFPILGGHVAEELSNNTLFIGEAIFLFISAVLLAWSSNEVLHMSEVEH